MGKTTRWIRSLFRPKKKPSSSTEETSYTESLDANKHAIAVAAATAAVAEAALAAAHAAAEVVRLTAAGSGSRAYHDVERRRGSAAVTIQSGFRAYLARRALRALKALVKLQSLVRGRIVRKQSADVLRRMQALARVQARVCATRASISASPRSTTRSSNSHAQPKSKSAKGAFMDERLRGLNWLENWMEDTSWNNKQGRPDDERSDKILEVDTWKPRLQRSPSNKSSQDSHSITRKPWNLVSRHVSREVLPLDSVILAASTTDNTPRAPSPASRPGSSHNRSPFSEYSRSVFGDYLSYPNYMANTESSRAKLRSHSAPRQRIPFDKSGSTRLRWDYSDTVSERGFRS